MTASSLTHPPAAVIGAGPAGLMAAEMLAQAGVPVDVYDAMPSAGRKLLLAGKGGLNLTHAEPAPAFGGRYRERSAALAPLLAGFDGAALRDWARGLGVETFVGSSGRVFPVDMKAAPLLRAWMHRLRQQRVRFHQRWRWTGWHADGALRFDTPAGEQRVAPGATVLALGGGSWARLGSDGAWVAWLREAGVDVRALEPANCGFDVGWSEHFSTRHAGAPLKNVALEWDEPGDAAGPARLDDRAVGGTGDAESGSSPGRPLEAAASPRRRRQQGEFVVTATGVEGSLVYAASAALRETLARQGQATCFLDLLPARDTAFVATEVARPRGSRSLSTHLKSRLGLDGVKMGLLHEALPRETLAEPAALARAIKALPLTLRRCRPLDEAISCAGGVRFEALDAALMLKARPGVFCAGEMLDWEAPTGGYLLTACFATGRAAPAPAARPVAKQAGWWRREAGCEPGDLSPQAAHPPRLGIPVVHPDAKETERDLDTLEQWLARS
jgi:predicted flavoprotein YhiN